MSDEIQKLSPGITNFNFDELTVEELEQRLELAIGALPASSDILACKKAFDCLTAFVCGGFGCTGFA